MNPGDLITPKSQHPSCGVFKIIAKRRGGWLVCHAHSSRLGETRNFGAYPSDSEFKFQTGNMVPWTAALARKYKIQWLRACWNDARKLRQANLKLMRRVRWDAGLQAATDGHHNQMALFAARYAEARGFRPVAFAA